MTCERRSAPSRSRAPALEESPMNTPDPVSWRAIVYGTPVLAVDGTRAGSVREVLGSDAEDVFHGVRMTPSQHGREDAMVPADRITSMTQEAVTTDLTMAEISALPPFDEVATYHLASVGWLRKHLGWARDAESDEEPG